MCIRDRCIHVCCLQSRYYLAMQMEHIFDINTDIYNYNIFCVHCAATNMRLFLLCLPFIRCIRIVNLIAGSTFDIPPPWCRQVFYTKTTKNCSWTRFTWCRICWGGRECKIDNCTSDINVFLWMEMWDLLHKLCLLPLCCWCILLYTVDIKCLNNNNTDLLLI